MKGTDKIHQDGGNGTQRRYSLPAGWKWQRFLFLSAILALASQVTANPDKHVLLIRSGNAPVYHETQEAFNSRLQERCAETPPCPDITAVDIEGIEAALAEHPQLVITLGH